MFGWSGNKVFHTVILELSVDSHICPSQASFLGDIAFYGPRYHSLLSLITHTYFFFGLAVSTSTLRQRYVFHDIYGLMLKNCYRLPQACGERRMPLATRRLSTCLRITELGAALPSGIFALNVLYVSTSHGHEMAIKLKWPRTGKIVMCMQVADTFDIERHRHVCLCGINARTLLWKP
jgi:hypothetical protein